MDVCKHSTTFLAVTAIENFLIPNVYELSYSFRVTTASFDEQNIAFGRVKHLINERVSNSIIIQRKNPKWKTVTKLGNNIMSLPAEPLDFPVACAIFRKLESITEGKFQLVTLQLSSVLGEHVEYILTDDDDAEMDAFLANMPRGEEWWLQNSPDLNSFQDCFGWEEVNLGWDSVTESFESVRPQARVIQFNPVVIEGGNKG